MIERSFQSISQISIVDQVIDIIINSIIKGEYKTGDKLPSEQELIRDLQVSRNSLREAMKILATMGIVEIKRGNGTYICSQLQPSMFDRVVYSMIYNVSSSDELLELREILDEATVKLAMEKITPIEIEKLQRNIDDMRKAVEKHDIVSMEKYDIDFHLTLIESCRNVFFIRIMKNIYNIFEKSIITNIHDEKIASKAPDYHQRILDCIKEKNYNDIHLAVKDSLLTWKEKLKG